MVGRTYEVGWSELGAVDSSHVEHSLGWKRGEVPMVLWVTVLGVEEAEGGG